MKVRFIAVLFISFLLCSCERIFHGEEVLGNGYYYLPKYEAIDVGFPKGSVIYQSNNRKIYSNVLIESGIIEAKSDRRHILVGQNREKKDSKDDTVVSFLWIIDKKTNIIYGPLSLDDYLLKKKELGVSNNLQLKCEKKIR